MECDDAVEMPPSQGLTQYPRPMVPEGDLPAEVRREPVADIKRRATVIEFKVEGICEVGAEWLPDQAAGVFTGAEKVRAKIQRLAQCIGNLKDEPALESPF